MIYCLVFDPFFKQKDIVGFESAKFSKHMYDPQQFTLSTSEVSKITTNEIITLIDELHQPLFSGIVTSTKVQNGKLEVSGYDLKYFLQGILYPRPPEASPVSFYQLRGEDSVFLIEAILKNVFPHCVVKTSKPTIKIEFSMDIRLKNVYELFREICISSDKLIYDFFFIGSNTIQLVIKETRDLSSSVTLLAEITHTEIERIKNIKESYNQVLGLGAGEGEKRDWFFLDKRVDTYELPKCYIFDIREGSLSREELERRTIEKFKQLTYQYNVKFRILPNEAFKLDIDYHVGDLVTFKNNQEMIVDLISCVNYEVVNGQLKQSYEVETGLLKGNLTDKIKELKEGGYK